MTARARQVVVMIVVAALITGVTVLVVHVTADGGTLVKIVAPVAAYALMVGLALAAARLNSGPLWAGLGYMRAKVTKQLLLALLIFIGLLALFTLVPIWLVGKQEALGSKAPSVAALVLVVVFDMLVGLSEELVFRGYFLTTLAKVTGHPIAAVIITSVAFGLWHYPNTQNLVDCAMVAAMGFVWGLCRLKLKDCSTLTVGVAHGLNDAAIAVLSTILL